MVGFVKVQHTLTIIAVFAADLYFPEFNAVGTVNTQRGHGVLGKCRKADSK
jgi:hypothetical protein